MKFWHIHHMSELCDNSLLYIGKYIKSINSAIFIGKLSYFMVKYNMLINDDE